MGTKRGVQTELALARVRTLAPRARTGDCRRRSATSAMARDALLGVDDGEARADRARRRGPEAGRRGCADPSRHRALPVGGASRHADACRRWSPRSRRGGARSSSPTRDRRRRSGTRRCSPRGRTGRGDRAAPRLARPEDAGLGGARDARPATLRCVVATSSLDLGVDFSPVDRVLQVGSPKGVARLLQRAGRSGHQPGGASRVTCVPTNALELLEVAAVRDGMRSRARSRRDCRSSGRSTCSRSTW